MNNATTSEIFENARLCIINSALGKALGLNENTQILDAAIAVEGVIDNSGTKIITPLLDSTNQKISIDVPKGYWGESSKIQTDYAVFSNLIGLTADKLAKDNTILGINGSLNSSILAFKCARSSDSTATTSYTATEDCFVIVCGVADAYNKDGREGARLKANINGTYVINKSQANSGSISGTYIGKIKPGDTVACEVYSYNHYSDYQSGGAIMIVAFK